MTEQDKSRDRLEGEATDGESDPGARAVRKDYEIGYGKPPAATRFAKGRSGNPNGRPKKLKAPRLRLSDAPSDVFLEHEAYRPITVRENGKTFELPLSQAILRAMTAAALKGNRLSQQYLLEWISAAEKVHLERAARNYVRLERLKREGEKKIQAHRRDKLPPPVLLPHPDDIVLRPAELEAYVRGPETPEETRFFQHVAALRAYCILRSAHAERIGAGPKIRRGDDMHCMHLVFALALDQLLPKSLQWRGNHQPVALLYDYLNLPRRERVRRISAEYAHLKETKPEPLYITREMKEEVDRVVARLMKPRARGNWAPIAPQ